MPDEMSSSPQRESIFKSKTSLIILAIAVVICMIIAAWLIFKPQKAEQPAVQTNQPAVNNLAAAPSVITWQDYVNATYGYSLQYPDGWFLDTSNADKDFVNNVGGNVNLSNKQNPTELLKSANAPPDLITMNFAVYAVSSQTDVDKFISNQKYSTALNQIGVTFAGLSGKQLLYVLPDNNKKDVLNIITVLKKDTRMYVFSYFSFKPDANKLPPEVATIHDEILKTFLVK